MRYGKVITMLLVASLIATQAFCAARGATDKQIKAAANPILNNILTGMERDDYMLYAKDFAPSLKMLGAKTKFFKVSRYVRATFGQYVKREYLGCLSRDDVTVALWKVVFSKSKDEVLVKLELSRHGNKYLVTGLWFQ
ncbi:MAG: hypothetical protein ABII75_09365 [Candidatus Omnitrophota bacterium]